jgi:hypothetical protein
MLWEAVSLSGPKWYGQTPPDTVKMVDAYDTKAECQKMLRETAQTIDNGDERMTIRRACLTARADTPMMRRLVRLAALLLIVLVAPTVVPAVAIADDFPAALRQLQALHSIASAGVTVDDYQRRVLDAKIVVDRYLAKPDRDGAAPGGDRQSDRALRQRRERLEVFDHGLGRADVRR